MNERAFHPHTLANAVRQRRLELRLDQVELAEMAGCSTRFVHSVEAGKASLRLDKVMDVLGVLGLSLRVVRGPGDLDASHVLPKEGEPAL